MSIDERLEALTQTVELMAAMQRDNEERWNERFGQIAHNFTQVTHNFETVLDSIKRLENIAAAHEQRIDDLKH
jgi:hypothetical protein